MCSSGHSSGSGGHHAWASCSWSRPTSAPGASQAWPISIDQAAGGGDQRLDLKPLGLDGPFLGQLAAERARGSSPASTAPPAPSAHTPAQVATHSARRPASQRPSLSRTTHSTDSAPDGVAGQPQRPAHLLRARAPARRRRRRSARAGPRRRRATASRGRAARRSRGRPRPSAPATARRASRSSERSPGPAARDRARGFRAGRTRRISGYPLTASERRSLRQEHAGRLRSQGGPRQDAAPGAARPTRSTSPSSTSSAWAGRRATSSAASSSSATRPSPPA